MNLTTISLLTETLSIIRVPDRLESWWWPNFRSFSDFQTLSFPLPCPSDYVFIFFYPFIYLFKPLVKKFPSLEEETFVGVLMLQISWILWLFFDHSYIKKNQWNFIFFLTLLLSMTLFNHFAAVDLLHQSLLISSLLHWFVLFLNNLVVNPFLRGELVFLIFSLGFIIIILTYYNHIIIIIILTIILKYLCF